MLGLFDLSAYGLSLNRKIQGIDAFSFGDDTIRLAQQTAQEQQAAEAASLNTLVLCQGSKQVDQIKSRLIGM